MPRATAGSSGQVHGNNKYKSLGPPHLVAAILRFIIVCFSQDSVVFVFIHTWCCYR